MKTIKDAAFRKITNIFGQRSGNVAVPFALLLLPMIGTIGLALDFGQVLTARTTAQVASDAALLQVSGLARELIQAGDGSPAAVDAALAEAKRAGEAMFNAYAKQSSLKDFTFSVTATRSGQMIEASANFSVTTNNIIAHMFGQDKFAASGQSMSRSSLPNYATVYAAVDISQSMGLGATNAEMIALYKVTSPSCVFGCHVPTSSQGNGPSNQAVAKAKGIKLRIDVLRDAVNKMIQTAKDDAGSAPTYQFGLYTMGANPSDVNKYKLTELTAATSDYDKLKTVADGIDLGPNNSGGQGDSNFGQSLRELAGKVPEPGDGSSKAKSKGYVFIMTDGVKDIVSQNGCLSGSYANHCMGPIDPDDCALFKKKGLTVGVLYTTYLPVYANPSNTSGGLQADYINLVYKNNLYQNISPKLQECASPGWFFEASDTSGINEAMRQMFEQVTTAPTLIN